MEPDEGWVGPLAPGSRLAGYRLEAQLGAGGMAVVYSAIDERLDRRVALKVLAPGLAADAEFRQRFTRESRIAATVEDPNIIPVYEVGEAGGVLFIAMRFVSGGDLSSLMRREGPLTPARAAELISPVASALDTAHRAGLVHRDVKPGNVLVDTRPGRPDHVYLSDFGLSKSVASVTGPTQAGQFVGTPAFAAPEQIGGQQVDGRADQYALACLAFALLAGTVPFHRTEPMAVLWAHAHEPPPSLLAVRPDLPGAVDQVVARALAKAPADRFASCQDFVGALRAALGLLAYHPGYGQSSGRGISSPEAPEAPEAPEVPQAVPGHQQAVPASAEPLSAQLESPVSELPIPTPRSAASDTTEPVPEPALPAAERRQASRPARHLRYRHVAIAAAAVALVAGITTAVVLNDNRTPRDPAHLSAGHSAAASASPAASRTDRPAPASTVTGGPSPPVTPSVRSLTVSVHRTATLAPGVEQGRSVAFSPNGKVLATAYYDSTELWDTSTHGRFATLTDVTDDDLHHVEAVAFSPDGAMFGAADFNGNLYLWNVASQTNTAVLRTPGAGPTGRLSSVAFSPDGKLVVAGDEDGTIRLWNAATGTPVATLPEPGSKSVESVAFSPDSKTLATGDSKGFTYLWNVATRARIATLADPNAPLAPNAVGSKDVASLAFSPNGKVLATGDGDEGTTYLWNLATRTRFATLTDPGTMSLTLVTFSPDGKLLASSDWNGSAYLWDVATGTQVAVATDPTFGVTHFMYAVAFAPNGKTLVTQDGNFYTFLWQVTGG